MIRKLTSLTLTLYLLTLLTQPCQDVLARAIDEESKQSVSMRAEVLSDPCSEGETCSPFCICSCCSLSVTSSTLTATIVTEASTKAQPARVSDYTNLSTAAFQNAIWQPPKA